MPRKKGKTGRVSYEGEQYRGGRGKGKKNLVRVDGGYQNKHGVTFTEEQKKALERAVDRSNYRRKKMLEHEAGQDWVVGGKSTGQKRAQLQLMGKENDFIISRQSKSLQRFKSMEDYERYMEKQESIQSGEYLEKMTEHYKTNYKKALDNAFNDEAKDIKDKLDSMSGAEFRALVEKDELAEIGYIYDPKQAEGRLAEIRNAFGIKAGK